MVNTLSIPSLGQLEIVETYAFYDEPVLFSCKNAAGHLYLVVAADENDQFETWLYAKVSNWRLNLIRSGQIDLHDAFFNTEDGNVVQVCFPYDNPKEPSIESVKSELISQNMLPIPGECLDYEFDIYPVMKDVKGLSKSNNLNQENLSGVSRRN